jgi:putative redox protein
LSLFASFVSFASFVPVYALSALQWSPMSVTLSLDWAGDLSFHNAEGSPAIDLRSSAPGIASPPQALAYATMACMAMDVVHVITKGRHDLRALKVEFEGERAGEAPRRFVSMHLKFILTGEIPPAVVERAITLSKTKYCSVSNTLRPDIDFQTTFEIRNEAGKPDRPAAP